VNFSYHAAIRFITGAR